MSLEEYFGDWLKVIDCNELNKVVSAIKRIYSTTSCEPAYNNIFKVFNVTPYNKLCQVWILQDPYPQKGVATGIALGNNINTPDSKLSLSLNIVKESVINLEIPHNCINFDPSLESWSKQGVLLLNSALTVETNKPGSHTLLWKPFIEKLLKNLSIYQPGLIYILWGNNAKALKNWISPVNHIIEMYHPAWYVRNHNKIPSEFFVNLNNLNKKEFDRKIEYFKELEL